MMVRIVIGCCLWLLAADAAAQENAGSAAVSVGQVPDLSPPPHAKTTSSHAPPPDYFSGLFVFVLATFIGLGVVARVSRLLHTPLMSLTNAISGIAVVGSIIVAGEDYPFGIRMLGCVALFASMTNVVSGFLITDRMLKMFKQPGGAVKP
jgi:NAD(P) transhydrogenase subunit alpha